MEFKRKKIEKEVSIKTMEMKFANFKIEKKKKENEIIDLEKERMNLDIQVWKKKKLPDDINLKMNQNLCCVCYNSKKVVVFFTLQTFTCL